MKMPRNTSKMRRICAHGIWLLIPVLGCQKSTAAEGLTTNSTASASVIPPGAALPGATAAAAATLATGATRYAIGPNSSASFLIDAPLEKIKGKSSDLRGNIDVKLVEWKQATGTLQLDLTKLVTQTFDDQDKNAKQTGHARNWLEVGTEVDAKHREAQRWATFTIRTIEEATNLSTQDLHSAQMPFKLAVTATGDLTVHGITATKTVKLDVEIGPARGRLRTREPLLISMKEHDVKPRDLAGRFLSGALEQVGQKIDDKIQVMLDLELVAKAP